MTKISEIGVLDLHLLVHEATVASHENLRLALEEVERLRGLLTDIVDICNTDPVTWRDSSTSDYDKVLEKIDEIAHKLFMPTHP